MYTIYESDLRYDQLVSSLRSRVYARYKRRIDGLDKMRYNGILIDINYSKGIPISFHCHFDVSLPWRFIEYFYPYSAHISNIYGINDRQISTSNDDYDDDDDDEIEEDDDWDSSHRDKLNEAFITYTTTTPYNKDNLPSPLLGSTTLSVSMYHEWLDDIYNYYLKLNKFMSNALDYKLNDNLLTYPYEYTRYQKSLPQSLVDINLETILGWIDCVKDTETNSNNIAESMFF